MDINDLRSMTTVLGLVCFLGICWWAYARRSQQGFDEAARLPFADDDDLGAASVTPASADIKESK